MKSNASGYDAESQDVSRDILLASRALHVHCVMRTYGKSAISTVASLGSIIAAAHVERHSIKLSIAVLDTSQTTESVNLHTLISSTVHAISQSMGQTLDVKIRKYVPEAADSYGYVATDAELSRIKSWNNPPDYVIFCNGDTYYAQEFFSSTIPFMMQNIHLIGVNWVPTMRHVPAQEQYATKTCKFEHGGVDLNGVLVSVKAMISVDASFAKRKTPCKNLDAESRRLGCKAVDTRPYFVADWGLFSQLLNQGETSQKCIVTRPLFLQN